MCKRGYPALALNSSAYSFTPGFGLGLTANATCTLVPTYFLHTAPFALATVGMGYGCGWFLFPLIWEFLDTKYGVSGSILIVAGICLNMSVCGALFRPAKSSIQRKEKRQEITGSAHAKISSISDIIAESNPDPKATRLKSIRIMTTSSEIMDRSLTNSNMAMEETGTTLTGELSVGGHGSSANSQTPEANFTPGLTSESEQSFKGLMCNPAFLLTAVAAACLRWAEGVTATYTLALAKERGIDKSERDIVIMAIGISDMAWIIPIGIFISLKRISNYRRFIYCALLIWMGLAVVALGFATDIYQVIILAALPSDCLILLLPYLGIVSSCCCPT